MSRAVQCGVGVVLLAAGVALGWVLARPADEPKMPAERTVARPKPIADAGDKATIAALRMQVKDLERKLREMAALSQPTDELARAGHARAGDPPPFGGPHGNLREHFERMKTEDPVRFAQMTNRMAQWRARRERQQAAKMEFLAGIDTSHMSPAARGVHKSLQDQLSLREELEQKLQDPNLTENERHEIMEELRESSRQVRALSSLERKNLIEEAARNMGFEGADVKEITSTMSEIVKATESGGMGPGGGMPPGPPPGGAGGAGGAGPR